MAWQWTKWIKWLTATWLRPHRLVMVNPERLELRAIIVDWPSACYLLLGLVLMALLAGQIGRRPYWLAMAIAIVFVLCLAYSRRRYRRHVVFDRSAGLCWIGRKPPGQVTEPSPDVFCVGIEDLRALRLTGEHYEARDGFGIARFYRLYLVVKDGRRICITRNDSLALLRNDARILSAFLDRPVWEAISVL